MLDAQVAVAAREPVPAGTASRIVGIAQALGDQRGIPAVAAQAALLDALIDPGWWDGVDVVSLERVRVKLRDLVRLIGHAGHLDPRRLYEDPFDGVAPEGPDEIFSNAQVDELIVRIRRFDESAEPVVDQATA